MAHEDINEQHWRKHQVKNQHTLELEKLEHRKWRKWTPRFRGVHLPNRTCFKQPFVVECYWNILYYIILKCCGKVWTDNPHLVHPVIIQVASIASYTLWTPELGQHTSTCAVRRNWTPNGVKQTFKAMIAVWSFHRSEEPFNLRGLVSSQIHRHATFHVEDNPAR